MQKKSIESSEERNAESEQAKGQGLFGAFRALPKDSVPKALLLALIVSVVGGYLVTSSTVLLKPKYLANQERERQEYLLDIVQRQPGMQGLFETVEAELVKAQVIDLETGQPLPAIDPQTFDQRRVAKDPDQSIEIPSNRDLANIKRREKFAKVYQVKRGNEIQMIILPVYGKGFTSTLYGYLGLAADGNSVIALSFYEHAETPGLGARVGDPAWLQQWQGKKVRDPEGTLRIGVARGSIVASSPNASYEVDGISGATWTSRSVTNLLRFWLGEDGFGPYLSRLQSPEGES